MARAHPLDRSDRLLLCVAHGRPEGWEAICLDYDIAVQGQSFAEVREVLNDAIHTYVEDAMKEDERTRRQLLDRRAPFWARLAWLRPLIAHALFDRNRDGTAPREFQVECHA